MTMFWPSCEARCGCSSRATVSVPLAYTGEQYHLRLHIHLLQEELDRRENQSKTDRVRPQAPLHQV